MKETYLEFSVELLRRIFSVSYWEGKQFLRMSVVFCDRDVPLSKSFVDLTSQFLSVFGGEAIFICCGGSNVDFIKALVKSPGRKVGIHFRLAYRLSKVNSCYMSPVSALREKSTSFRCYRLCFYVWERCRMNTGCK